MMILTVRTDKQEAELGLYDDGRQLAYEVWTAHRQLAETIHQKIEAVLQSRQKTLQDVGGFVCYKGPGSFTGLRIGLSTANALAYGLHVPIVGIEGENGWLEKGMEALKIGGNDEAVMPEYGSPVHITQPRK